jgi:hypothetical protein
MWWCRFGVDDGFGIMVLSGCREYVTEPVDVVLVVTGRASYVVVSRCMYVGCCGGGCAGGIMCLSTLGWSRCVHVSLCGVDVIIFNVIERYVSYVMLVNVE